MFLISNGLYLILYRTHVILVIHPKDRTTEMLSILYEGLEARLIESFTMCNTNEDYEYNKHCTGYI